MPCQMRNGTFSRRTLYFREFSALVFSIDKANVYKVPYELIVILCDS
jgi:hypothetical protein